MTVSSSIARGDYLGNGVTTQFVVPFYFLDPTHIKVLRTDTSTTPPTTALLVLNSDYTVTGAGVQGGGSITTAIAPTATQKISILRNVPLTQLTHYVPNDPFPAASHEQALDQLTMEIQQVTEAQTHSLQLPTYEPVPPSLPAASLRASMLLGFDANGNPTTVPLPASVGAGDLRWDTFVAGTNFTPGTTTSLTLSRTPGTVANVEVFFDATFQGPDQIASLVGAVLTFTAAIPIGVQKVFVRSGTTLSVQLPPAASLIDAMAAPGSKLFNRINDTVSIKDFGAQCDGVNDDTAALQAAINYVLGLPNGGTVELPAGTIKVTGQINAPNAANVCLCIRGAGAGTKIKYFGSSSVTILNCGSNTPAYGALYAFEDFGFVGPTGGSVTCILLNNINSSLFKNVNVFGNQTALALQASFNTRIIGCYFNGQSLYAISTLGTGTNNLLVSNCAIANAGNTAINLLVGGNNIVIRDNDMEANAISIGLTNYTSVLIEGNYIENGTSAAFYFSGANAQIDIKQNWLGANAVSTNLGNINGGSFERNTLYNSAWTSTATDLVIGHNYNAGGATLPMTAWNTPALLNGFTQQANYYAPQYVKGKDNFVTLRGNTLNGATGAAIFNLPAGYRPQSVLTFGTASSAGPGATIVEVRTNGDVWCITRDGSGGCGLNGIRFNAEQ